MFSSASFRIVIVQVLAVASFSLVSLAYGAVLWSRAGGDAVAAETSLVAHTPYMLLAGQLALALFVSVVLYREGLAPAEVGWSRPAVGVARWAVFGGFSGAVVGGVYVVWLAPLLSFLQREIGDFVPPSDRFAAFGGGVLAFFVANVVFAPLVEETLFRGYGLLQLERFWGPWPALAATCVLFGALHLAGGFWYALLAGAVAGGLFGGLALWSGSLMAPLAAHFALNLVEFLFVWRRFG